ncbi:hypothetical protein PQG02_12045 [Nostoc sp. UHCC 0926]|nr:hypothetical protein [Nostoc sp. UHCC 0926]WDD34994.1 hypothetical protein PQG02_12045 [Nostoc sp. UHCC 0926]
MNNFQFVRLSLGYFFCDAFFAPNRFFQQPPNSIVYFEPCGRLRDRTAKL